MPLKIGLPIALFTLCAVVYSQSEAAPAPVPTEPSRTAHSILIATSSSKYGSDDIAVATTAPIDKVEADAPGSNDTSSELERDATTEVPSVPFFSQFKDITPVAWRKISCGVVSLAMLVEYYEPGQATADSLLTEGIAAGAYISDAGWSHAGLIGLANAYGLDGASHDLAHETTSEAFKTLTAVLNDGPVMASVHYTFEPTNPIPHLVVITGVKDDLVYYNDPSEKSGGGSISIEKFKRSWKKRYIEIRPVS